MQGDFSMANITRYNPFNEVVSLREAMDRLFEDSFIPRTMSSIGLGTRGVSSNLHETADNFVLQVPMAGVKPDDVEITAMPDTVNLKWETKVNLPEKAHTHWSGFAAGQYEQSFSLPSSINTENVQASYENGILTLTLPKAEHAKARTIKINTRH